MALAYWLIWVDGDWEPNIPQNTVVTLHYTQTGAMQAVGYVIDSQELPRPDGAGTHMRYELLIDLPNNPGWIHSLDFPQGTVHLFPAAQFLVAVAHGNGSVVMAAPAA